MEPVDPQLEQSWFKIIDALTKQANIELYAVDAADAAVFAREQGSGKLKLSENGDLQIKQGKNWRVVKDLDAKLQKRLQLDEQSIKALAEYLQTKPKIEPYRHPPKETVTTVEESAERKELRRLGLEKLEISGYPAADRLIVRIAQSNRGSLDFIDIADNKPGGGREVFCRAWKKSCRDLPLPCVPPKSLFEEFYPGQKFPDSIDPETGDFHYLEQLIERKIVQNISGARVIVKPRFGAKETIYIMDWIEDDNDARNQSGARKLFSSKYESALLKELGLSGTGVMGVNRKDIDEALWADNTGQRNQTTLHLDILDQLGLDANNWEIHCIRQDQYARLAKVKSWGQHELLTHYEDYVFNPSMAHQGLVGGYGLYGGASFISNLPRDYDNDICATRLVISRKRWKI